MFEFHNRNRISIMEIFCTPLSILFNDCGLITVLVIFVSFVKHNDIGDNINNISLTIACLLFTSNSLFPFVSIHFVFVRCSPWTLRLMFKMGRFNEILREYMANSSLHGVRFLIDENIHFVERIFWLVCVILSWIASALLIMSAIDAFQHNAISFVVETSFRDWDTHFPAIVVCEAKNTDRVQEIAERYDDEFHIQMKKS